jgi:hypothetical protein
MQLEMRQSSRVEISVFHHFDTRMISSRPESFDQTMSAALPILEFYFQPSIGGSKQFLPIVFRAFTPVQMKEHVHVGRSDTPG